LIVSYFFRADSGATPVVERQQSIETAVMCMAFQPPVPPYWHV